ncbi:IclR family transcriptional regulator [Rhodococcus artemisiae]|uniref:Helix-turn-helix domain-containing protein n=1 Tax=Rhodococcus artemisiae TaxID=714159 RepID=A0ABU7L7E5_9NOCA|nr:helix-turn-helix domain-containing protein [Rhodococcus artemisiae]MEE2057466.1 helix-turn-helix domain-containing protein [Rhodococcus artemisiae]
MVTESREVMVSSPSSEARSGSRAVERAVAMLACFDDGATDLSLSSLAARTGLPVSSAYRIAQALLRGGLLERVPGGDGYRIGPGLITLAVPPLVRAGVDFCAPQLYALAAGIEITTSLGVVRSGEVLTLFSARPPEKFCEVQLPRGRQPVASSVMGQVMLAFSPSFRAAAPRGAELEQIRRRGFAVAPDASDSSLRAVAVPVFDHMRRPWGAIGVQARRWRLTDAVVRQIVPPMRRAADRIGGGSDRVAIALEISSG